MSDQEEVDSAVPMRNVAVADAISAHKLINHTDALLVHHRVKSHVI